MDHHVAPKFPRGSRGPSPIGASDEDDDSSGGGELAFPSAILDTIFSIFSPSATVSTPIANVVGVVEEEEISQQVQYYDYVVPEKTPTLASTSASARPYQGEYQDFTAFCVNENENDHSSSSGMRSILSSRRQAAASGPRDTYGSFVAIEDEETISSRTSTPAVNKNNNPTWLIGGREKVEVIEW